jgi:putative N6-adenine-specific DNA methylase
VGTLLILYHFSEIWATIIILQEALDADGTGIAGTSLLMSYSLYATCPDELTGLLAEEIAALGGTDVRTAYRVVYFSASREVFYRVHLHSRLASRIYRILKEIPAQSPTIVFDKARRIRFHELFSPELAIGIEVVAAHDEGPISNHLIGSKLREAINDCFQHHLNVLPNPSSRNAVIKITGYFHRKRLMVSVDTSGESLHRRGFRLAGHPAPLKETLAAALLAVCGYDGNTAFFDPMCGSGTIAIEAALVAINRAPGLEREKGGFGFEQLLDFDPELWQTLREQARRAERPAPSGVYASDLDPEFIRIARKTAARARLEEVIRFERRDFFQTDKPAERGLLIANIPYGVRMEEKEIDRAFMRAIGDRLKKHFTGWRCGILAPTVAPLKEIGLKPQKQAFFLNGTVPVKFVVFDIY